MKRSLPLLIILAFIVSSCEKPTSLDIPTQAPRLGVHAIWGRDSTLEVQVTRTFSVTETPQFDNQNDPMTVENKRRKYGVTNASVLVYKDGVLYDQLVFDPQDYIYKTAAGKTATPDAHYSIKVAAPGFEEVVSPVVTFPGQVPIKTVEVKKRVANDGMSGSLDEVIIEFDDPATVKNYYWIILEQSYSGYSPQTYYYPTYVYPVDNDLIIPAGGDITTDMPTVRGDCLLLKDDNFNGQTKRLVIRISSYVLESAAYSRGKVTLSFNNASEDLFKYVRSRLLDVENPFATPVQAYTNITNGMGVFGLYAGERRELQ